MQGSTSTPLRAVLLGDEDEQLVQQLALASATDGGLMLSVAPDAAVLGQITADIVLVAADTAAPFPVDAVRAARAANPAPVVAIADRLDAEVLHRAATAGVADVVIAEQPPEHLAFALRRAALLSSVAEIPAANADRSHATARVVTAVSLKGGAGTSSVAVNLATSFAAMGHRTLLVDLDLYGGDAALAIGSEPQRTIADVTMSSGDLDVEKLRGHATTHESGLDVLAAPTNADDAPLVRVERLHDLLCVARDGWDVVVLDTGSVLDEHLVAALEATDELLVVATPDVASVRAARRALRAAEGFGFPTSATRVVLNRAGMAGGLAASEAADTLGHRVGWRVPEDAAVSAAWNAGRPVAFDRPGSPAARALAQVASDLVPADPSRQARATRSRRLPLVSRRRRNEFAGSRA